MASASRRACPFPLMRKVATPSAILDRIDRLVPVLEPPRDHLEMWFDRRGLGVYAKALKSLGARRVSDLALLEDEDLDAMGFTAQQKRRDPRARRVRCCPFNRKDAYTTPRRGQP